MRANHADVADYRLYYHGTFMRHDELGPVSVSAEGGQLYVRAACGGRRKVVEPKTLEPLWIRPGAYNVRGAAIYIGRRARRNARRSSCPDHYMVKWSGIGARMSQGLMWSCLRPEAYLPYADAVEALENGIAQSVAISRDLILSNNGDGMAVILRGQMAGTIRDGLFTAPYETSPLAKMARGKLSQEGVVC